MHNTCHSCWGLRGIEHILTVLELYLLIVKAIAVDFSGIINCFNGVVELGFFLLFVLWNSKRFLDHLSICLGIYKYVGWIQNGVRVVGK